MGRILTSTEAGKRLRLNRIFSHPSRRVVVAPLDDSLIAGPECGLANTADKVRAIVEGRPNALIAFSGLIRTNLDLLDSVPFIINLTASTRRSCHTRKVLISTTLEAIKMDAAAVAVHVNVTSRYESDMLQSLGRVSDACQRLGMPLFAIMYPRKEAGETDDNFDELREQNVQEYAALVAHCVRIAAEMGADIIKTQYTGDAASFRTVVDACRPVPVLIAGGPVRTPQSVLTMAAEAVEAGAAGVSFGRNIFAHPNPTAIVKALCGVVHDGQSPVDVFSTMPENCKKGHVGSHK